MSNLDRYNEHILQGPAKVDSFIANVNYLARKFDSLMQVDEKFDVETVKLLAQLVKNSLDINIKILSEDLRKGSYYGYRKLDIDLLTNFKDYDYFTTDEEKNKLWNDPSKQVYYSSVDVWLSEDNTEILHKDFENVISNHHQLYQELVNWNELVQGYGFTTINLSPDTPILNHELLRITDDYTSNTAFGTNAGSKIMRIALNVAKESGYNSLLIGAKEDVAVFTWVDSTSALLTIANKINDIIHAANVLNEVGTNIGEQIENAIATLQRLKGETQEIVDKAAQDTQDALIATKFEMSTALEEATETLTEIHETTVNTLENIKKDTVTEATALVNTARVYKEQVETAVNKQVNLTVESTTIDSDAAPTVEYDAVNNKMMFSLPRSESAIVGLTNFDVNTDNGHLILNLRDSDDILNAYINESGNIILEVKSGD
jgi:hypothetical protein